jgi:hypothetical protein
MPERGNIQVIILCCYLSASDPVSLKLLQRDPSADDLPLFANRFEPHAERTSRAVNIGNLLGE